MVMTGTMKGYGTAARHRAEAVGHRMKDRMLERRLDRASHEAERLRLENEMLRDEVEDSRTEHHRILDMLEERLPEDVKENGEVGKRSHKGRWMLFLLALAGGAYAISRQMRRGDQWTRTDSDRLASDVSA